MEETRLCNTFATHERSKTYKTHKETGSRKGRCVTFWYVNIITSLPQPEGFFIVN